jgi:hypothetical protein
VPVSQGFAEALIKRLFRERLVRILLLKKGPVTGALLPKTGIAGPGTRIALFLQEGPKRQVLTGTRIGRGGG